MPPRIFLACLAAGGALTLLFPIHLPLTGGPLGAVLGLVIGACGVTFMMTAHETFKRTGTPVPTNPSAETLVVRGAYRFSRNPMYVGGSAIFLGLGLALDSPWLLAAYLPLGGYLALHVIPQEEAYTARTFGEAYRDYCRRTRRWL